jgi:hypothetical protein
LILYFKIMLFPIFQCLDFCPISWVFDILFLHHKTCTTLIKQKRRDLIFYPLRNDYLFLLFYISPLTAIIVDGIHKLRFQLMDLSNLLWFWLPCLGPFVFLQRKKFTLNTRTTLIFKDQNVGKHLFLPSWQICCYSCRHCP